MDRKEAVELVNSIKYRPGVEIRAEDRSGFFGDSGAMNVNLRYRTKDTGATTTFDPASDRYKSVTYAEQGYPKDFPMNVSFDVPVDRLEPEEVLAYVLRSIIALEVHEAREFFRVGAQNYEAPFHPHVPAGTEAWGRAAQSNSNYHQWGDQHVGHWGGGPVPVFTKFTVVKHDDVRFKAVKAA